LCVCPNSDARGVFVEHLRQRFDRFALFFAEIHGDLHVDGDEQIALVARALAAHTQHLARRRAGRDPHRHLPVERRDLHVGTDAASANVTGNRNVRSLLLRPNHGCERTCTTTYKSPGGPPLAPAAPDP
jgi:hypothetical protein